MAHCQAAQAVGLLVVRCALQPDLLDFLCAEFFPGDRMLLAQNTHTQLAARTHRPKHISHTTVCVFWRTFLYFLMYGTIASNSKTDPSAAQHGCCRAGGAIQNGLISVGVPRYASDVVGRKRKAPGIKRNLGTCHGRKVRAQWSKGTSAHSTHT